MKLLSVQIGTSGRCGGILDGFELFLRNPATASERGFEPLCLIGPNGAGKSQFLQTLAEIFQAAWNACAPLEERQSPIIGQPFTVEYLTSGRSTLSHVRISQSADDTKPTIERLADGEWIICPLDDVQTRALLPTRVIGYTSGENETLSVPFFASRAGYAEEVAIRALPGRGADQLAGKGEDLLEPRLMLIDYGTHLELLVANLLLGTIAQRKALLAVAGLESLRSVRCVIQLAGGRRTATSVRRGKGRKGVQLTDELETYVENLKACSTCWDYEADRETYPFAGANARNLVPMGPRCNSSYKLAQDVLRDAAMARRVCFDPYAADPVSVSLMNSTLFARNDGLPSWVVDFGGDQARIKTWDDVFDIKRRFVDDHLDSIFKMAIKVFGVLRAKRPDIVADGGLVAAFTHLGDLSRVKGWTDRAFLETAVYDLLKARSIDDGEQGDRLRATFGTSLNALA